MTLTYGFYNSINNDRKYNASQMSSLFDGIINDGVFMSIGDAFIVSAASDMNVTVGSGRAWFNHTWSNNDAEILLTVEQSELVLDRIDTVVIEINSTEEIRANIIKIIKGTPSSEPIPTELAATETINQHPLCYIYVASGVTEIVAANITNTVGTALCPFVTGILETMEIDALLAQWNGEFHDWFSASEDEFDEWFIVHQNEFDAWFATVQDTLSGDTAGNLLNLINDLIKQGTGVISNIGWVENVGLNAFKIDIPITGVVVGNWVEITIDKEYQDIASEAEINPTIEEHEGGITIYANRVPSEDIPIRYKVV